VVVAGDGVADGAAAGVVDDQGVKAGVDVAPAFNVFLA